MRGLEVEINQGQSFELLQPSFTNVARILCIRQFMRVISMLHVHRELKRRKVAGTKGMLHELGGAVIGPRCLPSIWVLPFVCEGR